MRRQQQVYKEKRKLLRCTYYLRRAYYYIGRVDGWTKSIVEVASRHAVAFLAVCVYVRMCGG